MASNNDINIRVKSSSKMARESLHDLSNSFVVLNKDGKRANTSITGFTNSLGSMSKVIRGIGLYKLAQGLATATQSAVDITESIHMYNIAMGDFAESTGVAIDKLSELTGLDRTRLADTIGEYNLLARSMGMTAKNASVLSENTNRLALDLSALSNRSLKKVSEDLRSGLIGQSKTMYKYGIDVTEAAIKQEALNQGISKSVRHMSQGEKMALRYSVMIKQSGLAHGDFANTIDRPANQLRIFSDRMLTLTRTIGTIFIPMLTVVMPYLNAVVKVLTKIVALIAKLVGYDAKTNEAFKNTGVGNIGGDVEDLGKESDKTGKKVDKLKKKLQALAGFDELNIIGQKIPDSPKGGGKGDDGGGGALDFDLEGYDSLIDQIQSKTDKIAKDIEAKLAQFAEFMKPTVEAFRILWDEGLSKFASFTFGTIMDFYNSFLKPMATWTLGEGLIRLFEITNALLNEINWDKLQGSLDRLYKALLPFGLAIGQGLLDFYDYVLKPIGVWIFNVALDRLVNALANGLEKIDFGRINDGFINLWKSLTPFTLNVGEGLLWFLEQVLIPISSWTMDNILPLFLEGLANIFTILNNVIEVFKPLGTWLWDNFLQPLGLWTGEIILSALEFIVDKLKIFGDWILENEEVMQFWMVTIGLLAGTLLVLSNPMLALKGLIVGLIGGFTSLYKNNEDFRNGVDVIWNSIVEIVTNTTQVIRDVIVRVFTSISEFWNKHGEGIMEFTGKVWGAVFNIIKSQVELGLKIVTTIMTKVQDFWSKNGENIKLITSTIWGKISNYISTFMKGIESIIMLVYNAISKYWEKNGEDIRKMTEIIWNAIGKLIDVALGIVTGIITAFAGLVTGDWSKFGEGMMKIWSSMWEGIKAIVGGAWKLMGTVFGSLKRNITGWFDDIVKMGFNWGKNLIGGFIDGIKDMGRWVGDAVGGVMNGVKDFMGFQSPTKKGVGRDADKWMPNMMNMFEDGIQDNRYKIVSAMEMTVGDIGGVVRPNKVDVVDNISNAISMGMASSQSKDGGTIINIGERTILDTLTDGVNRENRINGKNIITI